MTQFVEARQALSEGNILAYPTEAVYGLGCDPFNQQAVERLLALKERSAEKGLILLISKWSQLFSLIRAVPDALLDPVRKTWPGPVTWVFPKSARIPYWISGTHDGVAIRLTAHPIARELCMEHPLVSTSANLSGHEPATDLAGLELQFPMGIDGVFVGDLGGERKPCAIYDVISGEQLR